MSKILLINQAFYPDVVATSQQLTDLAKLLASRGHQVTVIAGDHGYEDARLRFSRTETYCGIQIHRLASTVLGKTSKWRRAIDFLSFYAGLCFRLLLTPRQDIVVGLTSPPLVAVAGNFFCFLKGGRFIYWVMDMNPDEAVAAGWLKEDSRSARFLKAANGWAFRRSRRIVALDRFMKDRIVGRYGIDAGKIEVLPPWSLDDHLRPVRHEENPFRKEHGLKDKFVVMYSGNHSPCHPLSTLLEAARTLRDDKQTVFYFVGGGSLVKDVRVFKEKNGLENIVQLGYQPLEKLSESLSAADLHVVAMGDKFVGIVHPCKLYGILAVGRPFVFVGSKESHGGDLIRSSGLGEHVNHGDTERLVRAIRNAQELSSSEKAEIQRKGVSHAEEYFSRKKIGGRLVDLIETSR